MASQRSLLCQQKTWMLTQEGCAYPTWAGKIFILYHSGSLWDVETAFIAQGVYIFAHIQSGTNSLEVPFLISAEMIQLWAYAQLSRPPVLSIVLFLSLATLRLSLGQNILLFSPHLVKMVLRSLETLDFHPLLINVYSMEDAFNSPCSNVPDFQTPRDEEDPRRVLLGCLFP